MGIGIEKGSARTTRERRVRRRAGILLGTIGLLAAAVVGPAPTAETPESGSLSRVSRLQGAAKLGRNRYVIGATVLVRRSDELSHWYVTGTDYKGRFRVDGLPDGEYRVEIRRDGLRTVVKEGVLLRYPSRAVIEVGMEPQDTDAPARPAVDRLASPEEMPYVAWDGEVVAQGGTPMSEVPLRFTRPDGAVDPVVVQTEADGTFELPKLPVGRWRLEIHVVGYLPIWVSGEVTRDARLTISMVPQPASYEPTPLELMPPEQPFAPERFRRPPIEDDDPEEVVADEASE
jgi:hypothetical protein